MSLTAARAVAGVYHLAMLYFVTWPGIVPFAKAEPLVFGLPFTMAWIAGWIAGSVIVLTLLDQVEKQHRAKEGGDR